MDTNGFLTFAALIVAAWAILPRVQKLRLSLAFNRVERSILVIVLLVPIRYLLLYDSLAAMGYGSPLIDKVPLSPGEIAYILLGGASMYIWARLRFARIGPHSMRRFQQLLDELQHQGSYTEAMELLKRDMARIAQIRAGELLTQRVRAHVKTWTFDSPVPFAVRMADHLRRRGVASSRECQDFCVTDPSSSAA